MQVIFVFNTIEYNIIMVSLVPSLQRKRTARHYNVDNKISDKSRLK